MGDHLRAIYRYKWFVLGSAVLIAEIVLVVSLLRPATYEAESSIWITVDSQDGLRLDEERADYAGRVYAEVAESPRLIELAIEASGLSIEPRTAERRLDVDPGSPPGFVDIVASGPSASSAARLADGMAKALVESVEADTTGADTTSLDVEDNGPEVSFVSAQIIVPAVEPSSPSSPQPVLETLTGFVVALVVLAEMAALWRPARGLLPINRTAERVTELIGIPCLTLSGDPEDRTRLGLFVARHLVATDAALVVHCSKKPQPTAAIRLGEAMATGGRRVLVADGEHVSPNMHRSLALTRSPGIEEVLAGEAPLASTVNESQSGGDVSLLTAGGEDTDGDMAGDMGFADDRADDGARARANGSEGTRRRPSFDARTKQILGRLRVGYDVVLIHVGSNSSLNTLPKEVAGLRRSTILVIEPERTTRNQLRDLVHGSGGHEAVVAILLMDKAAIAADAKRLAGQRWERPSVPVDRRGPAIATKAEASRLSPIRAARQSS